METKDLIFMSFNVIYGRYVHKVGSDDYFSMYKYFLEHSSYDAPVEEQKRLNDDFDEFIKLGIFLDIFKRMQIFKMISLNFHIFKERFMKFHQVKDNDEVCLLIEILEYIQKELINSREQTLSITQYEDEKLKKDFINEYNLKDLDKRLYDLESNIKFLKGQLEALI